MKPYKKFNSPSTVRLLGMILGIGVTLSSGLRYYFRPVSFDFKVYEKSAQTELHWFGRAEYEQLKIGMSLTDVRSILGRGNEVSRSKTMATFVWENPDGSKITATFEGDRLKSKEQSGLK